jgi:hypothetical protein
MITRSKGQLSQHRCVIVMLATPNLFLLQLSRFNSTLRHYDSDRQSVEAAASNDLMGNGAA